MKPRNTEDDVRELTDRDFARAIPRKQRPHGLGARQFPLMVEAGMTPLQAIQAATLVNARLLRMEGRIGTLAPGAIADVIAVRGNPVKDVRTLAKPILVVKDGAVHHRETVP
jgi:imidazolonepropionase-like amidohydrolase